MKTFIFALGGLCAAAAGLLVLGYKRTAPAAEDLAHQLQNAWADHHTVV